MENEKNTEIKTDPTGSRAVRKAHGRASAATWVNRAFLYHLSIYAVVMVLLYAINAQLSDGIMWVKWPAMFWGIGVVIHGLSTLFFSAAYGKGV
jgi:hypothetical protein